VYKRPFNHEDFLRATYPFPVFEVADRAMMVAMPDGTNIFGRLVLSASLLILALSPYALAQVQSGVQSGLQSGVRSGYDYSNSGTSRRHVRGPVGYYSSCWRTTVTRGKRIVWNCQPYPPPPP
jgi:hypothetical protein